MTVHILGPKNVHEPVTWVFPNLLACMDCGFTELTLSQDELRMLSERSG